MYTWLCTSGIATRVAEYGQIAKSGDLIPSNRLFFMRRHSVAISNGDFLM